MHYATVEDVYEDFVCQSGGQPQRSRDELQDLLHHLGLRYEHVDDRFWDAVFGSGWAWDPEIDERLVAATYRPPELDPEAERDPDGAHIEYEESFTTHWRYTARLPDGCELRTNREGEGLFLAGGPVHGRRYDVAQHLGTSQFDAPTLDLFRLRGAGTGVLVPPAALPRGRVDRTAGGVEWRS